MFKTPLIFIQIHDVIIPEVIFKSECCRYFGYLAPIYNVTTSAEMKLIDSYENMSIWAHTVRENVR